MFIGLLSEEKLDGLRTLLLLDLVKIVDSEIINGKKRKIKNIKSAGIHAWRL